MPQAALRPAASSTLLTWPEAATGAVEALLADAAAKVRERVVLEGRPVARLLDREQRATHGLAWLATYVEAVRQLTAYAERMQEAGLLGEVEELIVRIGLGEYLAQIQGGIPISQGEIVRPADLGLSAAAVAARMTPEVEEPDRLGQHRTEPRAAGRADLSSHGATVGACGLDETLESIREEMRKFADSEVIDHAQGWHRTNSYIPLEIISQMAELGVFGLTIPEEFGGMGLGKESMCVVSEELSRGYIGVGSLGTRSEIAAELILGGGTEEQKRKWLPKIASGEVLPTAVFTEPNTGSDLASLKTRATRSRRRLQGPRQQDLDHASGARRPDDAAGAHQSEREGLSRPLHAARREAARRRHRSVPGRRHDRHRDRGARLSRHEGIRDRIRRLRGEGRDLLGGVEGLGFKQLMATFESARIQTAARAIGVAQSAMEQALTYAQNRVQFGEPIVQFPRVADKIAIMAVEIMIARQLTYYAARQKDSGRRCDLEAGMAKLLAARIAWSNADNAVQIHGGNGFAMEFPISRILCDARILSIFEGAAEIQAQVIARRLLDGSN